SSDVGEWDLAFHPEKESQAGSKKRESGPEAGPEDKELDLDAWVHYVDYNRKDRFLVPEGFQIVGWVDINRPIYDFDEPFDDLLSLLPHCTLETNYAPATWDETAYHKSFEKFYYHTPCFDIAGMYPREWRFATRALVREYSYLQGSVLKDITAVSKNSNSTPGFPKFKWWKTEADLLEERGYKDYINAWNKLLAGDRPSVLWYLFLKKEVLKESKIADSDIRQIVCADPIYARIGCIFEEHQNILMKQRTTTRFGQCGWSPFYGGFSKRIERLVSRGNPHFVEFDWTRFDGTIPVEVFRHIKRIRYSFIDEKQRTPVMDEIYDWYVNNLVSRYVLMPSGEITVQNRGNPSGQISTTTDNNMINVFLQAFEFAYLNQAYTEPELDELWRDYDSLIYGDDRLNTTPLLPDDYVNKVIAMYKNVFGMWVKPEKVVVSDSVENLSFCGFTVKIQDSSYLPVPTEMEKLLAALVKPVKKLQDKDSLYAKLLCYKILLHYASDDNAFKHYVLVALEVVARHIRAAGGEEPCVFTDSMLDKLWRGGPNKSYGI
ncbi:non-structural polyprotein 1AB, partial [Bat astrovirus Tm/Guangxi/LD71/2007]